MTHTHLCWATEQLHCLGVIWAQQNWAWGDGLEYQIPKLTRCSYCNGPIWEDSMNWINSKRRDRKRTLISGKRSTTHTEWYIGVDHNRWWACIRESDFACILTTVVHYWNIVWTNRTKLDSVNSSTERELWKFRNPQNESAASNWDRNSSPYYDQIKDWHCY